jgi:hypothetical protein
MHAPATAYLAAVIAELDRRAHHGALPPADPAYSGASGTTIIQPQTQGDGTNPNCLPPSNA